MENIMSREPVYAKGNLNARIVSVPNGLWRVQVANETKGTRERDNWYNRSHPIDKPEAMRALGEYNKDK